jgi:hypothetical protein
MAFFDRGVQVMSDRCEPPEHLRGVDGDYWLSCADTLITAYWYADVARWTIRRLDRIDPEAMPGWRYHSPVATPAEVEALRRERDAWQRACEENAADGSRWLNELATLRAANARLREVLEPFAETGDWWDRQYPNSPAHTAFGLVQCPAEESNFTLGDLRAARATLKEPTP